MKPGILLMHLQNTGMILAETHG